MNDITLNGKNTFKLKTPIIILSWIALVLTVISCITYFMGYNGDYNNGDWAYEFEVRFPSIVDLFSLILTVSPYVLLALYVTKFHSNYQKSIIVPVVFGLLAAYPLYYMIETIIFDYSMSVSELVLDIPFIVFGILATISALKGMSNKVLIIIALAIGVLGELYSLINVFQALDFYLEEGLYLYLFTWPIGIIGAICIYVALFLFCTKNKIPTILKISPEKEQKNSEKMSPEQALRTLKDKLELGMITEEEYQTQRAEIISKL